MRTPSRSQSPSPASCAARASAGARPSSYISPPVRGSPSGPASSTVPEVLHTASPRTAADGTAGERGAGGLHDGGPPVGGVLLVPPAVAPPGERRRAAPGDPSGGGDGQRPDALGADVDADPDGVRGPLSHDMTPKFSRRIM